MSARVWGDYREAIHLNENISILNYFIDGIKNQPFFKDLTRDQGFLSL